MADTAFQIQYRQEFIATFEQHHSLLRSSVTTEAVIKGNQATFLVAGSGGATATSRGIDGTITARATLRRQRCLHKSRRCCRCGRVICCHDCLRAELNRSG